MRILVFCPFNALLYGRTVESILNAVPVGLIDYLFSYGDPDGSDKGENVRAAYHHGQAVFLNGDWDAMLTVESDQIIPVDTLQRLTQIDAGVAYGLYIWRYGSRNWTAYTAHDDDGKPMHSVSNDPEQAREWWGTVQDVTGWGFGCTLIHRYVLELVDWTSGVLPDEALARLCNLQGVPQKCDLGVVVGHIQHKEALVLWPDPDADDLVRLEGLC